MNQGHTLLIRGLVDLEILVTEFSDILLAIRVIQVASQTIKSVTIGTPQKGGYDILTDPLSVIPGKYLFLFHTKY